MKLRFLFWLKWTVATGLGWIVAMPFALVTSALIRTSPFASLLFSGAVIGAIIGISTWFVVKPIIPQIYQWITANILGFAIGVSVGDSMRLMLPKYVLASPSSYYFSSWSMFGYAISEMITGVSVGIAQWLILRRHIDKSVQWPIINGIGWITASMLASIIPIDGIAFITTGIITGIITGGALAWRLREPIIPTLGNACL